MTKHLPVILLALSALSGAGCVDSGGRCHLGSYPPPEGWHPGDIVFYRCEDCRDRWDIELPDE